MTKRATLAACALTLLVCGVGQAQTGTRQPASHGQPQGTGTRGATTQPPPAVRLVRPDGSVSSADVKIRPDAILIRPNDSLDQILNRNHLSSDPATVEAIRRQNPSLNLDQLHTHAGQHLYVPKATGTAPRDRDQLLQIQDPNLARVQLRQDRREITTLQRKTVAHQEALFASPAVAARHQKALSDVSLASQRLEAFTPSMSARDVALLNFQLSRVQLIADPAVRVHGETATQLTAARVATLEQSARPMRSVLAVTGRSGVTYEDLRREVKVVVSGPVGSRPRPQRVYVLPAAMIERPNDYSDDVLLSLLRSLTYTNLTTPSSERFLFSDLAIWVGADDAYDVMLKRLRHGELSSRPVSIRESSPSVIEVTFAAP
jgi:hypothetical protein